MTEPKRWLIVATHPKHEGVVSFDLGPPRSYETREKALRHAVVHALHYFRDDEFEITDPIELPLTHTEADVDAAVAVVAANGTFHPSTTALRRSIA